MSKRSSRYRVWLALAIGGIGIAVAGGLLASRRTPPLAPIRITAGPADTSRNLLARGLASRLALGGLEAEVVPTTGDELAAVEQQEADLALVSSVLRSRGHPHVREVAPLHVEALHLLVKREIAPEVGATLGGLRGRRVDVGPVGSEGAALSRAVLAFASVAETDVAVEQWEIADLERRLDAGERDPLPDAIFDLATLPSRIALRLVRDAGYRLLPLPFADAFRLRTMLAQAEGGALAEGALELGDLERIEIPPFTYRSDPPSPAEPLPTLGATLLLLAHEDVPKQTIERVLDTVYESRFARIAHPPLERSALAARPRIRRHPGTAAFLAREAPILSAGDVDELNNTLGVAGALLGGSLFLAQGIRQARRTRRDRLFAGHMLRVAGIEQRLVALELASELDRDGLVALQRELLELKHEALDRFARGELGDHRALSELLAPVDVARDHVGALLLHVREQAEERAGAR